MISTLNGLRVVSVALNIPGPVAAAMLRDRGATVVKIEPPSGDPLSMAAPDWYHALTAGMQVRHLDLKTPDGRSGLESVLREADLFITATRPQSLGRLGLAWPDVHRAHPRLCHVGIVGHPAPREEVPGHDLTYQAEAGLLMDGAMPRTLTADLAGAEQVVIAALDLLLARERGNEPGTAIVSLVTAAALFAEPLRHGLTSREGPLGGALSIYSIYGTADGSVAVAALEPQFRSALARELHVEVNDRKAIAAALEQNSAEEWERWAEARGIPLAAIRKP